MKEWPGATILTESGGQRAAVLVQTETFPEAPALDTVPCPCSLLCPWISEAGRPENQPLHLPWGSAHLGSQPGEHLGQTLPASVSSLHHPDIYRTFWGSAAWALM